MASLKRHTTCSSPETMRIRSKIYNNISGGILALATPRPTLVCVPTLYHVMHVGVEGRTDGVEIMSLSKVQVIIARISNRTAGHRSRLPCGALVLMSIQCDLLSFTSSPGCLIMSITPVSFVFIIAQWLGLGEVSDAITGHWTLVWVEKTTLVFQHKRQSRSIVK
jgi:hypothetical protein